VSKYQFAESEIYLPGTDIPRNRLGIEEPNFLHEVEATLLQQAYTRFITELDSSIRFDEDYFKALHRNTYETVYEWAGLYRTVDMSKGGSLFCRAAYLEREARRSVVAREGKSCAGLAGRDTAYAEEATDFGCVAGGGGEVMSTIKPKQPRFNSNRH